MMAIKVNKENEEEDNNNDLNLFLNNNNIVKTPEPNTIQTQVDKINNLMQTLSFNDDDNDNPEGGNIFGDSIQNISEIKNNNSTFLFGVDDINGKN